MDRRPEQAGALADRISYAPLPQVHQPLRPPLTLLCDELFAELEMDMQHVA
jgi:hypothetical protein